MKIEVIRSCPGCHSPLWVNFVAGKEDISISLPATECWICDNRMIDSVDLSITQDKE